MNMRMECDDAAWERSDNIFEVFKQKITSPSGPPRGNQIFMASYWPWVAPVDRARIEGLGSFNLCYRMTFEDGFSSLLRFQCPGRVTFPEEKVRNEVEVI